ncbi:hypothetical protein P4045_002708 [Salmonella enterica]|nr:hypothetical protein [Salmonella enterica]
MWREARLAFTDSLAALDCSVVPAHPWIHGLGQQTDNGAYVTFYVTTASGSRKGGEVLRPYMTRSGAEWQ